MNRIGSRALIFAALILTLGSASGWAAGPPNPTASDADHNTAGGTSALVNNQPNEFTGTSNTAFGDHALAANTAGFVNAAFGDQALVNNTGGSYNMATGAAALQHNTTGSGNTASGALALQQNTTGYSNTATGVQALGQNTIGAYNTAAGEAALFSNTTGDNNTATGTLALNHTTTGDRNTAAGVNALRRNTTGHDNLALGFQAVLYLTSGSNNIYLGNTGGVTESNTLRLGQTQTRAVIAGVAGTHIGGAPVVITSSGLLGVLASSARYKRDITDMGAGSQGLRALRPVSFRYTEEDPAGPLHYGLIAEEVAPVYPELVTRSADGTVEGVQYHELIPMLLNELQHQQQALDAQAQQHAHALAELAAQTAQVKAALLEQFAAMAARLAELEAAPRVAAR